MSAGGLTIHAALKELDGAILPLGVGSSVLEAWIEEMWVVDGV